MFCTTEKVVPFSFRKNGTITLYCHIPYIHRENLNICICSLFPHDITYQGSPSLRYTAGPAGQTCLPRLPSCPSTTAPGCTPPTTPLRPPGVRAASHVALLHPSQTPAEGGRESGKERVRGRKVLVWEKPPEQLLQT